MRTPIERSKLLDRGGEPTVRDLLSSLVFNPFDGTIRLNGDRIVMQRAIVGAELRRELVRLLGATEARVFLMRLGFLSGQADARFVRTRWPNLNIGDAFTTGTRLHTFSGAVRVETVYNDFDFRKGRFAAEFIWHDSVEAVEHKNGRHVPEPVCWTQLGYASGYATEFFNTLIVYKEVECAAQGHDHCRVVGKPVSGWDANDPEVSHFLERIATLDGRAFIAPVSRPAAVIAEVELSNLDRVLLAPIKDELDRVAAASLPVLVSGEPGTGRGQAARYLHRASNASESALRSVFGASVDLALCDEISRRGKGGRRAMPTRTIVINAVESVPIDVQPYLAMAIGEGMRLDGPRIIGLTSYPLAPAFLASELWSTLAGLEVRLPTLAQRTPTQRVALAENLLSHLASKMNQVKPKLDSSATKMIRQTRWPGNLRQMRWVLTSVLKDHTGGAISDRQIEMALGRWPFVIRATSDDMQSIKGVVNQLMSGEGFSLPMLERSLYEAAVERVGGNLSAAARLLGLTRPQLAYRKKILALGGAEAVVEMR
jgi:Activator of aromatic catabolism/V4R domain/Bacterial regulatory protein, Fis family/Sigma-54 interaction domain